jgi:nitroreductase
VDSDRLAMPVGEAIFTQRAIRRFRPEPVAMEDLRLMVEAAVRAPNGGNLQLARFLIVTDRTTICEFGLLYREAWWAKRHDEGISTSDDLPSHYTAPAVLAASMGDVPCIALALAVHNGPANSVIPAVQNLLLSARALGIGSVPTTLHPTVMDRFRALFAIPDDVAFYFCVPLGYPRGNFGPTSRRPTAETTYLDRWGGPVPWS